MVKTKEFFLQKLKEFADSLTEHVTTKSGDWKIKGFIDTDQNIYGISTDTKIISKILEIQLYPQFEAFAAQEGYEIVLAEKQNWYPDLSFVSITNPEIKFAIDIKTTYRLPKYPHFCNGFTLGSHGEYFRNRKSTKNIQFPYSDYTAHLCLGILYERAAIIDIDETNVYPLNKLALINSVIKNMTFFAEEKWKIASDRGGSGNTANIGSINNVEDILNGNGVFVKLGEQVFDEYWINQGVLQVPHPKQEGTFKKLTKLSEFLTFKGMDTDKINPHKSKRSKREN